MRWAKLYLMVGIFAALALAGCATKEYVRAEVGSIEAQAAQTAERMTGVESQVEELQTRVGEHGEMIGELSQTAQEALERAIAAGKLAEGKFLYEALLSDDRVGFAFDDASLSEEARAALDEFAADLKQRNENIFVEIQGHTDAIGSEKYNLDLGEQRAEAVCLYLNAQHRLPVHRMSVISYGESAPVADNGTRQDRALNRRVALVVLQ
ncbi:MAG: OmpA family protein [Thermoanaerobaculia bacterium]